MPTIEQNREMFESFEWSKSGDEWSAEWGGTSYLWHGTIFPRIQAFVPTDSILEIAPGFGRCTQYLIGLCKHLTLVDLSQTCIDFCYERFAEHTHITYLVNDGKSLDMLSDDAYDFVFSWDSLVHVESDVLQAYMKSLRKKMKNGGFGFIHHSNLVSYRDQESDELTVPNLHWRAETMSAELFREYCDKAGLRCISQEIVSWGGDILSDCFSLFIKEEKKKSKKIVIEENKDFMKEAFRLKHLSEFFHPESAPPEEEKEPEDTGSILDRLETDEPLFHDDGQGGLITWYSNKNLLRTIEDYVKPGMQTIEIGAGYSTVVFLYRDCFHTCIVPSQNEVSRISSYCEDVGIALDRADFRVGQSSQILPSLEKTNCDLIFVDGAHRFPFPIVDWFYCAMLLRKYGLIVIDDIDIISCHILYRFMLSDPHWEKVDSRQNFAIFRKLGTHDYPIDWQGQPFGQNRILSIDDLVRAFYPKDYLLDEGSTYAPAIEELEGIMKEIKSESVKVDFLASKVSRAADLIEICRSNLRTSENEVKSLLTETEEQPEDKKAEEKD